jgi:hypothetical protein
MMQRGSERTAESTMPAWTAPSLRRAWLVTALVSAPIFFGSDIVLGQDRAILTSAADSARPGANRLFFAPTGRTLPAGVSEAGAYMLVAPYIGHAFHDRFMIAAGTPLITESFVRYWYVVPKVGLVASPMWNLAVGAFLIVDAGVNPLSESGGRPNVAQSFFWGVVTYGSPKAAITVGATSDMGTLSVLPDGNVMIVGAEYELRSGGSESRGPAARLIAESYWPLPSSGGSPLDDSLSVFGIRIRTGRVAFELVDGLVLERGDARLFSKFPLFNVSFLF